MVYVVAWCVSGVPHVCVSVAPQELPLRGPVLTHPTELAQYPYPIGGSMQLLRHPLVCVHGVPGVCGLVCEWRRMFAACVRVCGPTGGPAARA